MIMSKKLFVGSLAWATNDESLKNFFSQVGAVESARVIFDRATGRSKGFGFVEFTNEEDANTAMKELDGKDLDGRPIRISEANAQEERGGDDNKRF
jgi:cold-inducible RNA-binding protein